MSQKSKKINGKVYTAKMVMNLRRKSNRSADGEGWIIPLGAEGKQQDYFVAKYYKGFDAYMSPEQAGVAPTGVYLIPTDGSTNYKPEVYLIYE